MSDSGKKVAQETGLDNVREEIDAVDEQIHALISQRARLARRPSHKLSQRLFAR